MCGGGGSPAPPPPPPPAPKVEDPAVQEAIEKERLLHRKRKGRQSTILTSVIGELKSQESDKKTLLGS